MYSFGIAIGLVIAFPIIYLRHLNKDLQRRIDKAIECIENNMQYDDNIEDCWTTTNDLLKILKEEGNNEEY